MLLLGLKGGIGANRAMHTHAVRIGPIVRIRWSQQPFWDRARYAFSLPAAGTVGGGCLWYGLEPWRGHKERAPENQACSATFVRAYGPPSALAESFGVGAAAVAKHAVTRTVLYYREPDSLDHGAGGGRESSLPQHLIPP